MIPMSRLLPCRARATAALALLLGSSLIAAGGAVAQAECRPPADSHEAKLLAFYTVPIAFSPAEAPAVLSPWTIRVGGQLSNVPSPSREIQQTGLCFQGKSERTRISPVFPQPRIAIGLPANLSLEASYVPPVKVSGATPNLGSVALAWTRPFAVRRTTTAVVQLRAHGTFGHVTGAITCDEDVLQSSNPTAPCYGDRPSDDTFKPNMFGGEGTLGLWRGRWGLYGGGGVTWLRPRFQVGFNDLNGYDDRTRVLVNLTRGTAFGGLTFRPVEPLALSAQVYAVPSDATTFRLGASYLLGWR